MQTINRFRLLNIRNVSIALFLIATLVFLIFPDIDLSIARHYWRDGNAFVGNQSPPLYFIHQNLPLLVAIIFIGLLTAWLFTWSVKTPSGLRQQRKNIGFILLAITIGPGLVVNEIFKDHWGRARPAHLQEFGGTKSFTPAWVPSNQCDKNCSFVCGDASMGFVLIVGMYINRRRYLWLSIGLTSGALLGLMRMAQGGHFFSDVIFSGFLVCGSVAIIARLLKLPQNQ